MDNGKSAEETPIAQEQEGQPPQEARCWIDKGLLHVEVPLFMPNGEYVAYGMLHKAQQIVNVFFRAIEREAKDAQRPRIITPAGMPGGH